MVTMTSKGKNKATPYQHSHTLDFTLEVVSMTANGDVTAICKLCLYEGQDVVELNGNSTQKRKHRSDIQYFTKSFNPHKYRSHHAGQHKESWAWYQTLLVEDKKQFFDAKIPDTNTLHQHMDLATDTLRFFINAPSVETIVDDLFFRDNKQLHEFDDNIPEATVKKAATKAKPEANAMKLFVQNEDNPHYTIIIKNVMRFDLTMDHVSVGMSFRETAAPI